MEREKGRAAPSSKQVVEFSYRFGWAAGAAAAPLYNRLTILCIRDVG